MLLLHGTIASARTVPTHADPTPLLGGRAPPCWGWSPPARARPPAGDPALTPGRPASRWDSGVANGEVVANLTVKGAARDGFLTACPVCLRPTRTAHLERELPGRADHLDGSDGVI